MIAHRWLFVCLFLAACSAPRPVLPTTREALPDPETTLVWVGTGEAERFENGVWKRVPEFDYEFTVLQRRYRDHWESTKELHRRHPDYDGSAGPRDQTYFFYLDYQPSNAAGEVESRVDSSLGQGQGQTDREFRNARLEMKAEVSSFAPFDSYRITQKYRYEEGALEEQVELFKKETAGESPWIRNHEEATLFAAQRFPSPPTTREQAAQP
jgi:hypothetical protein